MSRILVAVAWPYANGPFHLGHGSFRPPTPSRIAGQMIVWWNLLSLPMK